MTVKSKNPFVNILKRDNDKIKNDRATRIGQSLKEAQTSLILEQRAAIRKLEDKKSGMTDLSASNNSMDVNRITDIDAAKFVADYHKISLDIELAARELEIAIEVGSKEFGIDSNKLFE